MERQSQHDTGDAGPIHLSQMPHQVELRDWGEDWTGMASAAERRKLQNRLNQRAYRRRRHKTKANTLPEAIGIPTEATDAADYDTQALTGSVTTSNKVARSTKSTRICTLGAPAQRAAIQNFAERAYNTYMTGARCPAHLSMLVAVNMFLAMRRNADVLGINTEWHDYDAISRFSRHGPGLGRHARGNLPASLAPTALQLAVPHHPWIDLFPLPRLRDNILRVLDHADAFDEDELCLDVVENVKENGTTGPCLLVWGDPTDPYAWEASVTFLRKWGWLLEGCREMLDATNYWREKRGEKRLRFEV